MANGALRLIGEPPIALLDDTGRRAARECKAAFAGTRDWLLRQTNWLFAKNECQPNPELPAVVPSDWGYRVAMPADAIAAFEVLGYQFEQWEERAEGDDADPRLWLYFLCDPDWPGDLSAPLPTPANPTVLYTRRVTNVAQWDPVFRHIFKTKLAATINPAIGRDKTLTADLNDRADKELRTAMRRDAQEQSPRYVTGATDWVRLRYGVGGVRGGFGGPVKNIG